MKRLFPRIVIGFLTLTIGYYVYVKTNRIADYLWPDVDAKAIPPYLAPSSRPPSVSHSPNH